MTIIYNNGPMGLPDGDLTVFMVGVKRCAERGAEQSPLVELTCQVQVSSECKGTFKTLLGPNSYMRKGQVVCDLCAQELGPPLKIEVQRGLHLWAQ